ncbi:2-hydroxy-3-oxopropionate reductase [Periconia macrospinosa]|uniref:3-hydroxyisobutyrate dehydrogenase n=1 Tax=Periconia macrospinosa TaxID=97972 RepID=A0A2V1DBC3_9PLEO|nr:2-hydroxy-3-oxopropionate reductase [Periconia macrospinosa]
MVAPIIGFVGLGHAGFPMAASLAKKGHHLLVRDQDTSRGLKFVEEHPKCRAAASDAGSFSECEVVVTSLSSSDEVKHVLLGEHGIAPHLKPGSIVIDTSSCSAFDTRALGLELSRLHVDLVDSPITQEQLNAFDNGRTTLMVGSDKPEVLKKIMPILKHMSSHVFPMGCLGSGNTMQTLNSYVNASSMIALCDSLVTGQKLGMDPQTMIDVMNVGTGANFTTKYLMKNLKSNDPACRLEPLVNDVRNAKDLIEKAGFETELPSLALRYLEDSLKRAPQGANHSACLESWEKRAGVNIAKTEWKDHSTKLPHISQDEPVLRIL